MEKFDFGKFKFKTNKFEEEIKMKKIEDLTGKLKIKKEKKTLELLKLVKGSFCGLEILFNSNGNYENTLTAVGEYNIIFRLDIENFPENKDNIINYLYKFYIDQKEILANLIINKFSSRKKSSSIFKNLDKKEGKSLKKKTQKVNKPIVNSLNFKENMELSDINFLTNCEFQGNSNRSDKRSSQFGTEVTDNYNNTYFTEEKYSKFLSLSKKPEKINQANFSNSKIKGNDFIKNEETYNLINKDNFTNEYSDKKALFLTNSHINQMQKFDAINFDSEKKLTKNEKNEEDKNFNISLKTNYLISSPVMRKLTEEIDNNNNIISNFNITPMHSNTKERISFHSRNNTLVKNTESNKGEIRRKLNFFSNEKNKFIENNNNNKINTNKQKDKDNKNSDMINIPEKRREKLEKIAQQAYSSKIVLSPLVKSCMGFWAEKRQKNKISDKLKYKTNFYNLPLISEINEKK